MVLDDRNKVALRAQAALAAFLAEEDLWPEEAETLQAALSIVSRKLK